jgi:predicted HTH domain antitoxin
LGDKRIGTEQRKLPQILQKFFGKTIVSKLDEKINLGKAAELIGVHRLELQNELRAKGVPIRGISKEDAIAEVEAIREWRKR